MFTIVSVNVNGVRAAARRGGISWLARAKPNLVLLQEVRGDDQHLTRVLEEAGLGHWNVASAPSATAGRAGVAILSAGPLHRVRTGVGSQQFADTGRWIEATVETELGPVTAVSVYVHTGQADSPRQAEKYQFLDAMTERMTALKRAAKRRGGHVVVGGDLNVAHHEADIRNWKGNIGKAGFLPAERSYLDRWAKAGWIDLGRSHAGDVEGPFTWWTWRGQAFDRDVGWRIDYLFATPDLADELVGIEVGRAASYAQRWSDHAPITARFR